MLLKEIEILRKLNHPNIISLKEIFEDHKFIFIVLQYLEGIIHSFLFFFLGEELFNDLKMNKKYDLAVVLD